MGPLVSHLILHSSLDSADPVRQLCRAALQSETHRTLLHTLELKRLDTHLRRAGIETLWLKGPALSVLAWGDPGLRSYVDIDLLVHRRDLATADWLLRKHGYAPLMPLNHAQLLRHARYWPEFCYRHPIRGVYLDLHWAPLDEQMPFASSEEQVWARTTRIELFSTSVTTLDPESSLLHVAIHAAKHNWARLSDLCDFVALSRNANFDWDFVLQDARRLHARRMLAIALALCQRHLQHDPPRSAADLMREADIPQRLLDRIANSWLPRATTSWIQQDALYRASMERRRDRLTYWTSQLRPTAHEWPLLSLPAGLEPAYRLLRLLRLARKHAPRLASVFPRNGTIKLH
jgi:hypothetical protein